MREIRLSGSGEGPSWATARPTLQATFHAVPPARVPPAPATLLLLVPTPGVGPPALPTLTHAWPGRCPQRPTPAAGPRWWPPENLSKRGHGTRPSRPDSRGLLQSPRSRTTEGAGSPWPVSPDVRSMRGHGQAEDHAKPS